MTTEQEKLLESYNFFVINSHLSPDMLDEKTRRDYYSLLNRNYNTEGADGKRVRQEIEETDKLLFAEITEHFEDYEDENETILENFFEEGITTVTPEQLKKAGFTEAFKKDERRIEVGNFYLEIVRGKWKTQYKITEKP